jgi:hypothetical protein
MLKASLEHHPEILAARAKLRAAEAEQRQAELKALKDIMDIRDRWEKASQAAVATLPPNHPGILERLRNLAAIEWELAFLLGTRGEMHLTGDADAEPGRTAPQATPKPENASAPPAIESGIPRGEQGKLVKKLLGQAIPVDLEDMPLTDVVKYFSDQSGLRFVLDKQGLKNEGFPVDSPVTLKLKDAELGSALQALEDLHKPLSFVVRDYGILVTTKDYGPENAVSARDFWKLTDEEIRKKLRRDNRSGEMGGGRRVFLIHRVSH